jgi:ribitol 2-dehydrogenase
LDWPAGQSLSWDDASEASEVANVATFMLTRPRGMTIRHVVMLPAHFDL